MRQRWKCCLFEICKWTWWDFRVEIWAIHPLWKSNPNPKWMRRCFKKKKKKQSYQSCRQIKRLLMVMRVTSNICWKLHTSVILGGWDARFLLDYILDRAQLLLLAEKQATPAKGSDLKHSPVVSPPRVKTQEPTTRHFAAACAWKTCTTEDAYNTKTQAQTQHIYSLLCVSVFCHLSTY